MSPDIIPIITRNSQILDIFTENYAALRLAEPCVAAIWSMEIQWAISFPP